MNEGTPPLPTVVEVKITLNQQNGQLQVTGPFQDKMFFIDLLRQAMGVVIGWKPQPLIIPAKNGDIPRG